MSQRRRRVLGYSGKQDKQKTWHIAESYIFLVSCLAFYVQLPITVDLVVSHQHGPKIGVEINEKLLFHQSISIFLFSVSIIELLHSTSSLNF